MYLELKKEAKRHFPTTACMFIRRPGFLRSPFLSIASDYAPHYMWLLWLMQKE